MRSIQAAIAAGALRAALPALAAGFQDHAAIDREVAQFTGMPLGAQGGARLPVDRRLKLSQCPAPLSLEWYGNANQTVLVRCPIAGGWRLFVPVEGGGTMGAKAQPVVARGETVSIAIEGKGFSISRQGEALDAGAIGEWIRVRPAGAGRDPIRARITHPGKVGIGLP